MNDNKLNSKIFPNKFKDSGVVDVYSDNLDEDYIDAPVVSEEINPIISKETTDLQEQLKNRAELHKFGSYGNSVTDRNIMEQTHADGRRLEFMNQTSGHLNPLDPVYNSLQQNLVTASNVGTQYNQGTKLCHHTEDILGDRHKIGNEDLLSLKGNEGKMYLTTNSNNYIPQNITTYPVVQTQNLNSELKIASNNVNNLDTLNQSKTTL